MKIQIKYDLDKDSYIIVSEIKKERVQEFLGDVLRAQIGAGSDEREPAKKDIYTIIIDLELENDTFKVSSDTGNKSLTTGILMQLLQRLDKGEKDTITFK